MLSERYYNNEMRRLESEREKSVVAMAVCLELIKYKNERNKRNIGDIISNLKKTDLSQSSSLLKALSKEISKVDTTKKYISTLTVQDMLEEKGKMFNTSIDRKTSLDMAERIAENPSAALKHFAYNFNSARRELKLTEEERKKDLESEEERKRAIARKKLEEEQRKHPYTGITDDASKRLLSEDIDKKLSLSDYSFSNEEKTRIRELYPQIDHGNDYYSIDTLEKGMKIDKLSSLENVQVSSMIDIFYDVIDVVSRELLYNNNSLNEPDIFSKLGIEKSLEKYKKLYDRYMIYYQSLTPEQKRKEADKIELFPDYVESFGNHVATPDKILEEANKTIKTKMIEKQEKLFGMNAENCFRVISHATKYMEFEEIAELYRAIKFEFEKIKHWNPEDNPTQEIYMEYLGKVQLDFSTIILDKLENNDKEISFYKMSQAEEKAYYEERKKKIAAICVDILQEQPLSSFLPKQHDLEGRGTIIKETREAKEEAKKRVYGLSTVKKAMAQISGKWSRYIMLMEKEELNKQEQEELVSMFR